MIFAVDAGAESFLRIEHGLRRRYGGEYQVMCETSAMWGMKRLKDLKAAGEEVALILADQWMPDIEGGEFLARASRLFPTAKRAVLIEWGDRTAQEPVLRAMTLGDIDYYINKPGRPGDEYFHKMVAEFLYDWAKAHRPAFAEMRVVGERWSARSHELRDILNRNGILHEFYAADTEAGQQFLARLGKGSAKLPVVAFTTVGCSKSRRTPSSPTPSVSTARWVGEASSWSSWGLGRPGWRRPSTAPPRA